MATILQTIIGKLTATVEKVTSTVAVAEYRNKVTAAVETTGKTLLEVYTSSTKYLAQTTTKTVLQDVSYIGKTSLSYMVGKFVDLYYKIFSDSGQVTDSLSTELGKGVSDSLSLQDSRFNTVGKLIQDTGQIVDQISRQTVYARQYSDTTNIIDATVLGSAKAVGESLSLSDAAGIVNVYNRNIQDNVLATDDVNGAGADDDQNITFFKVTGDFTQVFDSLSFQNSYNRQFSDNNSVSDQDSIETGKFFYEVGNIQDSLSITTGFSRAPEDVSQITDIRYVESTKGTADSLAISDSLTSTINYFRSINDNTTATDDVNGAAADDDQNITFFKITGDLANFIDLVQFVNVFNRAFTDTTNLTDIAQVSSGKNLEDITSLIDVDTIELSKGLFDNNLVIDEYARIFVSSRSFEDVNSVFDSFSYQSSKNISDSGSVIDALSFTNLYSRSVSDLSNISDSDSLEVGKGSVDSLQIADALSFTNTYFRSVSDQNNITDSTGIVFSKNLDEYINLQDSIVGLLDYGRVPGDLVNVTDDVNGAGVDDDQNITFFKNLPSELVNLTSIATKESGKVVGETLNIASQGTLLNQNYGADYFAQDYVGVSRSFT